MSRHSGAGMVFAMDVDGAALAAEVSGRRPGVTLAWLQFPQALHLPNALRQELTGSIARLIGSLGPGASSTQRMHCESDVIATLADALMTPSASNQAGQLASQRLADLEGWIDAHVGESITVGRLCEVARVGARSLQQAFQHRRGMSPMRFVCERRLEAAHHRILMADVDDDITGIATSLGFTHLGRFSVAYREAFGETPSRTLQRGRRTAAQDRPVKTKKNRSRSARRSSVQAHLSPVG
jgi:AraC-like DNA-binding protein